MPQLNGDKHHAPSFDYLKQATSLQSLSWHNNAGLVTYTSPFFQAISELTTLKRLYVETPMSLEPEDTGLESLASM